MKRLKNIVLFGALLQVILSFPAPVLAAPLYSEVWGFTLDLPEGYEYTGGDMKDRFSFRTGDGAAFDLVVYPGTYQSVEDLAKDAARRIGNQGGIDFFDYRTRKAAMMELKFAEGGPVSGNSRQAANMREGWGLCVELEPKSGGGSAGKSGGNARGSAPLLLALAYGPAGKADLEALHLSALDSIAPSATEQHYCGPVTEFTWPRGELKKVSLDGGISGTPGIEALIAENDAEAAQALVDREFALLRRYIDSPLLKEAKARFYRAIYRDSWERIADACFQLERSWTVRALHGGTALSEAALASKALEFVQGFAYERDLMGSDFVNLVSAVSEGRGDCDSRALLWAVILSQANIPSCIMVSGDYSHAMGLADITGTGARFEFEGKKWLVAETTTPVTIGLIRQDISRKDRWLGVSFE
ncbi:hypothetical protein FACS189476_05840 [Spirochaetia bacterium]|nr:hypothetical protein FACS189476_05840 [Spirochaetia bacterium]